MRQPAQSAAESASDCTIGFTYGGYRVAVSGGVVASRPGASVLRVVSLPHTGHVVVTITPAR